MVVKVEPSELTDAMAGAVDEQLENMNRIGWILAGLSREDLINVKVFIRSFRAWRPVEVSTKKKPAEPIMTAETFLKKWGTAGWREMLEDPTHEFTDDMAELLGVAK